MDFPRKDASHVCFNIDNLTSIKKRLELIQESNNKTVGSPCSLLLCSLQIGGMLQRIVGNAVFFKIKGCCSYYVLHHHRPARAAPSDLS